MRLSGRRAVVTGGAQDIGRAIAERLAAEGARIAVLDRDRAAAAAVFADQVRHAGLTCDVADSASVDRAIGAVASAFGGIDILVCNAGIGRAPGDGSDEMYAGGAERAAQIARGEPPTAHADQTIT